VEALRSVTPQQVTRFFQGAPVRGLQLVIDVDESGFTGAGDAFLFGGVLDELFASHAGMNSFTEVLLRLQPSQVEYSWLPRNGRQQIC
jgi:type VI secretion system protein ImpG